MKFVGIVGANYDQSYTVNFSNLSEDILKLNLNLKF